MAVEFLTNEDKEQLEPFVFDVEVDTDSFIATSETTYDEITEAYNQGKQIQARIDDGSAIYQVPLETIFKWSEFYQYLFEKIVESTYVRLICKKVDLDDGTGNYGTKWEIQYINLVTEEILNDALQPLTPFIFDVEIGEDYTVITETTHTDIKTAYDEGRHIYARVLLDRWNTIFVPLQVVNEIHFFFETFINGSHVCLDCFDDSIEPQGWRIHAVDMATQEELDKKLDAGTETNYISKLEFSGNIGGGENGYLTQWLGITDKNGKLETLPVFNVDLQPKKDSTNPITSGAVYDAIEELNLELQDITEQKQDSIQVEYLLDEPEFGFDFRITNNVELRSNDDAVTAISFMLSDGIYSDSYISGLSFNSGSTPTRIDYTNSGILNWVGTDCSDNNGYSIFKPEPNKHYDIVFYFNGRQFIGLVNGFVPSLGNVVSE